MYSDFWPKGQYLFNPLPFKIKSLPVECSNVINVVCPGLRMKNQKEKIYPQNVAILVILCFLNFGLVCPEWRMKNLQKNIYPQNVIILIILCLIFNFTWRKIVL